MMSSFETAHRDRWRPRAGAGEETGLYRAAYEHDACGVGFVADISGRAGSRALTGALRALDNLVHRGAVGADARTSDGAGVLTQIPVRFFAAVVPALAGRSLALGDFAVGQLFLSQEDAAATRARALVEAALARQGLPFCGWRAVPVRPEVLGDEARAALPRIEQVVAARPDAVSVEEFERRLALARREAEKGADEAGVAFYAVSFSARTIVYKGLLTGGDLAAFYPDLADPRYETAVAIFHQRYSTNTAPTWTLAQPFRLLAHNGEINTVQGNRRWMAAREPGLRAAAWGDRLPELWPTVQEGGSDSASLDNVLDLLVRSGYGLLEALATTVGEAWEGRDDLDAARRAFYEYHAPLMEPWDGPAGLAFSDGAIVGAALDRNGLRPARYRLTDDGLLIVASEAGVLEPAGSEIAAVLESGRLGPGQMIAVDLVNGRLLHHDDIIGELAARHPYQEWIAARHTTLENAERGTRNAEQETSAERGTRNAEQGTSAERGTRSAESAPSADNGSAAGDEPYSAFRVPRSAFDLVRAQTRFGYSAEDLRLILTPMGAEGHEAVWSMGDDTPFAILSDKPHGLADYFRQRFAQVTNPPIDPLRERAVMSLDTYLGPRSGLLIGLLEEDPAPGRLLHLASPLLAPETLARLRAEGGGQRAEGGVAVATLSAFFDAAGDGAALAAALEQLQRDAVRAIDGGATVLIISDNPDQSAIRHPQAGTRHSAIPLLLAVAAVHQGLIRAGRRLDAEIVAEAGDAWSTHHVATLIAYGAAAVCPWLACASVRALTTAPEGEDEAAARAGAEEQYLAALDEGLRKIMSKMGISALRSYHGSGLFEALGLSEALIDAYFPGTPSPLGGIGLDEIAADVAAREAAVAALPEPDGKKRVSLPDHGFVRFRRDGERHAYTPTVAKALQGLADAVDGVTEEVAARYLGLTESSAGAPLAIRDLLALRPAGPPAPLDEVEPAEAIRRRFIATAMSLGALSPEAYTTLAAGMNRMGARSNSGEGGEDPDWYLPQPDGERRHSKIKQIASGRFGVTANYLVHAEELEIKMAQGSKPGEGGQLPAHKVTDLIARLRHAVPGTSLISPPPHHDIYSIEDIAQLIFDLRTVQPTAKIGVKLVATSGVGTIAAGVAKAGANYVLISGHSGGTGASPLSSIKHVGLPWELGLAEAQQSLIRSGLRDRVRLRTDGGLRTARDVVIAAALGAEDFGFGTAALIALGCDMARQCHLNTCPTGIATQRADLRAKFTGKPEQVVTYFTWLAEQVRLELAALGLRSLDEAVGRVSLLAQVDHLDHPRAATLDLSRVLAPPPAGAATRSNPALGPLASPVPLSERLLDAAAPALSGVAEVALAEPIRNRDRAIGAELAGALARRRAAVAEGGAPSPAPVTLELTGSAGQSFGAFTVPGLTLRLTGEANDYVGKGMSGGTIAVRNAERGTRAVRNAERGTRNNEDRERDENDTDATRSAFTPRVLVGNTVLYGATGGELFVAGAAGERFAVRNSGATAVVEGVGDHGCEYMTGGTVLVLGPTGRNFAAGMSEGRAFIFDEAGDFPARCNQELVNLTRLTADADELALVRDLLERHLAQTGSARARAILGDWDRYAGAFWLVTGKPPVKLAEPTPAGRAARAGGPGNGRAPIAVRRVDAEREPEPVSAAGDD